PREDLGRRLLQLEMRERTQVRLVLDERLAGVRVRRDGADLDVVVRGEEAEDLASCIAGCAGNGDRIGHASTLLSADRGLRRATPADARSPGSTRGRLESAAARQTSARG